MGSRSPLTAHRLLPWCGLAPGSALRGRPLTLPRPLAGGGVPAPGRVPGSRGGCLSAGLRPGVLSFPGRLAGSLLGIDLLGDAGARAVGALILVPGLFEQPGGILVPQD